MSDRLEARFRRLIRLLPADHRATYADEMLDVLMDSSAPGQKRPSAGQTRSLLGAAVKLRLDRMRLAASTSGWAPALSVFGLLSAVTLLAWNIQHMLVAGIWRLRLDVPLGVTTFDVVYVATLAITVGAALGGRRLVAAIAGWAAFAGGVAALLASAVGNWPEFFLAPAILTGLMAVALSLTGSVVGMRKLGRRGLTLLGAASILVVAAGASDPLTRRFTHLGNGVTVSPPTPYLTTALHVAAALLAVLAVLHLGWSTLVRLIALGTPIAVALALRTRSASAIWPANEIVTWLLLLGVPLLALALGVTAVQRFARPTR